MLFKEQVENLYEIKRILRPKYLVLTMKTTFTQYLLRAVYVLAINLWLAALTGCASGPTTLDDPSPESTPRTVRAEDDDKVPLAAPEVQSASRQSVPLTEYSKEHVYIFLVNGLDPLHYAGMPDLANYLRALGYPHVYYGEMITATGFADKMQEIARRDPCARFVLIGYSFGGNIARNITHSLHDNGISVDLLVYLNANTLRNTPYDRPQNAKRVVSILAWGIVLDGAILDSAENIVISDAWHFNTPTHPQTLQVLERELLALANLCDEHSR